MAEEQRPSPADETPARAAVTEASRPPVDLVQSTAKADDSLAATYVVQPEGAGDAASHVPPSTGPPDSEEHSPLLRESMLNLFYPAVLGAIGYSGLTAVLGPILPFVSARIWPTPAHFHSGTALAAALYVLTFTFYCCDYFYLRFTNTYRKLFFAFDCAFIAGLYVTANRIDAGRSDIPDLRFIVWCYITFIILYLVWDVIERKISLRQGETERSLYRLVLWWEGASLLVLLVALIFGERTWAGAAVVCVCLSIVTGGFVIVDIEKKKYCKSLPA